MGNWLNEEISGRGGLGPFLRFAVAAIWVGVLTIAYPDPVKAAAQCQTLDSHRVCLESIQRSAKYHWEYRVTVSVDGQKQAQQRYDCRQFMPTSASAEPTAVPTETRIGQWICRLMGYPAKLLQD
ncbi:MAG: hypothetical protein HC929_18890 [Leptolyngbyaceae cyanobacterium SM2_5_2]|nr:hypothetical protein [Leptolyngbyaceae cyanobacterium SM2_5_2]